MKRYEDASLKNYNTFGIDAKCSTLFKISSVDHLKQVLSENKPPYFVLGGGSNLLISKDQDTIFLKNEIMGIEVQDENEKHIFIKVGGGVNWHELVLWTVGFDFGGLENLSLIPGTVGASPIQNIGAYGVELDQVFDRLEAVNLSTGEVKIFGNKDCQFGYRDSVFKNTLKGQFFISHVVFRLTKYDHEVNISYAPLAAKFSHQPSIKEVSDAVIAIRQSKLPDPKQLGNSGSFFKNPIIDIEKYKKLKKAHPDMPSYPVDNDHVKVPAGWLIDQAGWKGKRIGDAGTYEKQALVIVNHGKATGPEIWDFAQLIIQDVRSKYGIVLQPEVNII